MVGGIGNRRDEGSLVINNTNVFAALETLRKKKKSDKDNLSKSKSSKSSSSSLARGKGSDQTQQQQVFWAPAPLKAKSWADVDDDEDDDYYATTAPPTSVWGKTAALQEEHSDEINHNNVEDTESDEDILDEGDEELEEEYEIEPDVAQPEPTAKKSAEPADVSVTMKETDRQLSKKEKKKKELAELEALLADFRVAPKESNGQDESGEVLQDKKDSELDGEGEKKDNDPGESKNAKKKKKKSLKEAKDAQDQPNNPYTQNGGDENAGAEQTGEDGSSVDIKERLKRIASAKKKKSGKEVDAAAKAAAQEAAARSAKLAAAKKKEKNHYNQQPVR